jgi:hypothetical protein
MRGFAHLVDQLGKHAGAAIGYSVAAQSEKNVSDTEKYESCPQPTPVK